MTEPRSAAQEASDPSTSAERLLELTEKHPQLQRLILLNPSCPEVARQWILATNPWAKRAYESSLSPATTDDADSTGAAESAGAAASTEGPPPHEDPAAEDPDAVSVWGDLGSGAVAATHTAPQEIPEEAPTASVRISQNAGVVPLGASPTAPTSSTPASPGSASPASAAPASAAPAAPIAAPAYAGYPVHGTAPAYEAAPPYGAAYGVAPAYGAAAAPAAGVPAGAPDTAQDGGSRTRRRAWYACGGCLLLALLLVIVMALVGRAWFAGDDEEYQRDSSTTAAPESPSKQPTEAPTEETTSPDPVSPAPEGAREMTELRSPTGNISCLLEKDSVACSVLEHDFSGSGVQGCEAGPFSIQVAEGEAARDCGSSALSENAETLEYDDSATYGNMACTSRFDGMTCWNTITGKGFMVNRVTYETF